ncbi:hypothetical protein KR222_001507, partial [Zaprionus bogoriensis]
CTNKTYSSMWLPVILLLNSLATLHGIEIGDLEDSNNPYYNHFGSRKTICPKSKKCLDGSTFNFLCTRNPKALSRNCKRFKRMPDTGQSRARMVNVHNGLRNKLAYDLGLANMNLVYWNIHLQHMAEQYLNLCRPYRDTCLVIGTEGHKVGHSTLYVNSRRQEILNEWEGRAVRQWFLKMGSSIITLDQLMEDNYQEDDQLRTLAQLIWPSLEFIGCSAAIMFDGFFVICYYYPPMTSQLKQEITYLGKSELCVCPEKRLMCSLVFTSLCGIDLNLYSSGWKLMPGQRQFIAFCIIINVICAGL